MPWFKVSSEGLSTEIDLLIRSSIQTQTDNLYFQNKLGDTPLHSAAWKNHVEAVRLLLQKGARVDIRNNENKTAVELTKDPEVATLLRQAGIDKIFASCYHREPSGITV